MFENRSIKLDLCALGLLAVCLFLGCALWTYDRADPPSTLIYPAKTTFDNACGVSGAYVAHHLLEGFGIGTFYLAGSLAILTFLLLMRREIDQPVVRAGGWVVSLVGLTTLAALAVPDLTPGPIVGAGGYIGAMGRGLLEQHFARAGSYIFAATVFVAGVLMCTDYVLLKLAALMTVLSGRGLMKVGQAAARTSLRPKTDVEDGLDGLDMDSEEEELGEEEEYEYEYEDEEDEEYEDEEEPELKVKTPTKKKTEKVASAALEATETATPAAAQSLVAGVKSALGLAATAPAAKEPAEEPAKNPTPKGPTFKMPKSASKKSEREEIIEQLDAADHDGPRDFDYELPPLDLLLQSEDISYEEHEKEVRRKARILEKTFTSFGFNVKVVEIETGPVIAQYEVQLEAGLRLSKITGLADDLAIALRVPSVRIVAPIPGKNTVGIEVPNEHRQIVRLREVIEETNGRAKRMKIPIYLGKDVGGKPMVVDLASLPHLLIAGRTGTGKSVCLNSIIVSMLMGRGPDEVRMLMIDPKMVELSGYGKLPHLMHPVVTDMRKAEAILSWAVDKMEERYQLLARAGVRHVTAYNQLGDEELRDRIVPVSETEWEQIPRQLPFIVIVADEIADLMMTAGKDVEQHIIRLAQKSRAVGIHLILATQKPTVDVITGLIKSNLPARLAFQVASRTDSRVVLDEMGADKLLGNGDMLFLSPGTSTLLRGQGTFLSDDEITAVVDFVGTDDPQFAHELMELKTKDENEATETGKLTNRDDLYEAAVDIVVRERRGSVSLLQRCLGIGYGRAARLVDFMAEDKIVGEYNGSQAREVMISLEEWEAMTANGGEPAEKGALQTDAPQTIATTLTGPDEPVQKNKFTLGEESDLEEDEEEIEDKLAEEEAEDEEEAEEEADLADDEEWVYEDEDEEEAEDETEEELADDEEWVEEDEEDDGEEEEELADDEEWVYEDEEVEEEELADSA